MKESRKAHFIGSITGCLAMHACDLGEATLEDGTVVTITWGRNMDEHEVQWAEDKTHYEPIKLIGPFAGCELIIPEDEAAKLRSILIPR